MSWLPLLLGVVSVMQAGLNRRVGECHGLARATVYNNAVLLAASLVLLWATRVAQTGTAGGARLPIYYYWLPGLLGLALVAGIPAAIARLGAVAVFTPLIAAQVLGSLLWDRWYEGVDWSAPRAWGAGLVVIGAALVSLHAEVK